MTPGSSGSEPGGLDALCRYVREQILPLRPAAEPVPFRGRAQGSDPLPFSDEMDAVLREGAAVVWNVTGPPGCGKTYLARSAAARWGARFLDDPESAPAVLWIDAMRLRPALRDERALTGGPFAFALAADVPGIEPEALARLIARRPFIAVIDKDEHPDLASWRLELPIGLGGLRILHLALKETLGGPSAGLGSWDRDLVLQTFHERLGREGVERIEALERSPAAALASYPCFAGWLLERRAQPSETIVDGSCAATFVREVHGAHAGSAYSLAGWCEALLTGGTLPPRTPSRREDAPRSGRRRAAVGKPLPRAPPRRGAPPGEGLAGPRGGSPRRGDARPPRAVAPGFDREPELPGSEGGEHGRGREPRQPPLARTPRAGAAAHARLAAFGRPSRGPSVPRGPPWLDPRGLEPQRDLALETGRRAV